MTQYSRLLWLFIVVALGSTPLEASIERPREDAPQISATVDNNFTSIHIVIQPVVASREVSAPVGVGKTFAVLRSLTDGGSISRVGAILRTYNVGELLDRQLNYGDQTRSPPAG